MGCGEGGYVGQRRPQGHEQRAARRQGMFAPSINVDLEKLKGSEETPPPARKARKVAARGGAAANKAAEKPAKD